MENDTNRLLLKSLQKDIIQINSIIHHLSKELKVLFHERNFFIVMFQLRSHLVTLHNGIHSEDMLSILNQVSVISCHKPTTALLDPLNLISLLIKLETQLVSHPRLALLEWNGEKIWYMNKFMKLQSFMMSNTLYVALHIPLVDKSLQFHMLRICNIPLVHPILRKSFRYSIQEEYLTIRLDQQYISFPLSTDIIGMSSIKWDNFATLTPPCMQQILQTLAVTPFSTRTKIRLINFAPCQS